MGSGLTRKLLGRLHVAHRQLLLVSALGVLLEAIAEILWLVPFSFCCGALLQGGSGKVVDAPRILIVRGGPAESPSLFSVPLFGLLRG